MARRLAGVFGVAMLSGFCIGQASSRVDFFGGFSYVNQDISLSSPNALTGWNASATFTVNHQYSVVADFSGYYPGYNPGCIGCGNHARIHTFLFGPQISITRGRFTPFARFLLGDTHMRPTVEGIPNYVTSTSNNSLTYAGGGGVDVGLTHRFALRGQVDWLRNDSRRWTISEGSRRFTMWRGCRPASWFASDGKLPSSPGFRPSVP